MYTGTLSACTSAHQKRALNSCELPCGCWKLKPGPLEEETVLFMANPSLQHYFFFMFLFCVCVTYVYLISTGAEGVQRRGIPLELDRQLWVTWHGRWGIGFVYSRRAALSTAEPSFQPLYPSFLKVLNFI